MKHALNRHLDWVGGRERRELAEPLCKSEDESYGIQTSGLGNYTTDFPQRGGEEEEEWYAVLVASC